MVLLACGIVTYIAVLERLGVVQTLGDSIVTIGALLVANVPEDQRASTYKALLLWGFALIVVAPLSSWALFVLIPW